MLKSNLILKIDRKMVVTWELFCLPQRGIWQHPETFWLSQPDRVLMMAYSVQRSAVLLNIV